MPYPSSVPAAVKDVDADALAKAFPGATVLAFKTDMGGTISAAVKSPLTTASDCRASLDAC